MGEPGTLVGRKVEGENESIVELKSFSAGEKAKGWSMLGSCEVDARGDPLVGSLATSGAR